MKFQQGFGLVTRRERLRANRFYEALTGTRSDRAATSGSFDPFEDVVAPPAPPPPQPYLPPGGRNFVPQSGTFNCAPAPFVVISASFLPERTTAPDAALDAALTATGLTADQRGRVTRAGLLPIAREFGAPALTELLARLRWSAADIVSWGRGGDSNLTPRLLIHIPGHFRELARRAGDARDAFVLECLGWLVMAQVRNAVATATGTTWWTPPPPAFVTAVPNPIPPVSPDVSRLLLRYLLIDTAMTPDQWNAQLMAWGTGLAGRQWQAEVAAPQPGRPFYASLAAIPGFVNTAIPRANFATAWTRRVADVDARHPPHPAGANQVTLEGLRNAIELRDCDNSSPHLAPGAMASLSLQGLELKDDDFPRARSRTVTKLPLMAQLHPVYTALFQAIRELGWNDLLYQTSGGGCFRGTKHPAAARITVNGIPTVVDPFNQPTATTVNQINTMFTAAARARVIAATNTARQLSQHGLGAAIDFNVPENEQNVAARPFGSMDPRIVAIFEAFQFRSGSCFNPTDPMHFEYCQAACAPAAAAAGALGPVVTPRMLVPLRAGRVVA